MLGEAVFTRLYKSGVRLQGRRCRVGAYEEVRPDVYCSRFRVGPCWPPMHCRYPQVCALCEEGHTTADHRCPVQGCQAGRGHPCPHGVAKCKNCGGPHLLQANTCPEKSRVWQEAKGWRSPPHHAGSGRLRSLDRSPRQRRQRERR